MIVVGFTGTRHGMTAKQYDAVRLLMVNLSPIAEVHHGDCVGADAEFNLIAMSVGGRCERHAHPPSDPRLRVWSQGDVIHDPKPYLKRDADIVAASTVMIACPYQRQEQLKGSGTWETIRMARKAGRPLALVYPDGEVVRERWGGCVTELSSDDLDLLRAEDCLVDLEAATEAGYDEASILRFEPWSETPDVERRHWRVYATAALEAAGLEPGQPSIGLLLAAIERRGWGYLMGDGAEGRHCNRWATVYSDGPSWAGPFRKEASGSNPATALALAFCQAVRAAQPTEDTGR